MNPCLVNNYQIQNALHYLDDFCLAGPPISPICGQAVDAMLNACAALGIPIAFNKLEGPDTKLTFLHTELDMAHQCLCPPKGKLTEMGYLTSSWLGCKKSTKC